ncbi:TlpA disulfide reductase family protein [Alysiella filiformis]|uniref:Peroxiredoxin n=1 Tax=Alysiella filiformis DSM 16848 TaxID=1120981 RepID=A0A286EBX2_9NEIS|nr:TlpA disulfide reductase family protein [Alysiella filiformis]UBQ55655.1 TlpA family protein disulfide reductase [Alysiella filiformis DSM 16848]SOD68388.1 Peroxiredoxin [Alysiella filiformis DSM 16848]
MKKPFILVFIALLIGALVFILNPSSSYAKAPPFSGSTLNNKTLNNQNLENKVTLINFWFPSCPGCVSEMPKLIKMAHDYQGKDFQIIGIAVPIDPIESVQNYAQTRQLPFDVVFDGNKQIVSQFVKTEVYPTSVLINKRGEVLKTFVGEPNFQELYQEVNQELTK